jgi:hypothetical protein
MVASIQRQEKDPVRAARLRRASHSLRRGGSDAADPHRDPRSMPDPRPSRVARVTGIHAEKRRNS